MTFESAYKELLKNELIDALKVQVINPDTDTVIKTTYKTVKFADNKQYEPLQQDPDEICGIVRGGNAIKSAVAGYDTNELTLTVVMYCKADYVDTLLSAAEKISSNKNAEWSTITVDDIEYTYRALYSTPVVVGGTYELKSKNGTIKAINSVWTITLSYSTNGFMPAPEDKLTIGGVDYDIDYLWRNEDTEMPNYDQSQKKEEQVMTYRKINTTRVYVYTSRVVNSGSLLQTRLLQSIYGVSPITGGITLKKAFNSAIISIPISAYNFNRVWENGTAAITITLTR